MIEVKEILPGAKEPRIEKNGSINFYVFFHDLLPVLYYKPDLNKPDYLRPQFDKEFYIEIPPKSRVQISTGVKLNIPENQILNLKLSYKLALRKGLVLLSFSSERQGVLKLLLLNASDLPARLENGEFIAKGNIIKL